MQIILIVISFVCLVFIPLAQAKHEPLPKESIAGVGPRKVALEPKEIQKIRDLSNVYYETAKTFANRYGKEFLDIIEKSLDSADLTNVVIAMGKAEHLGTLIELGLRKRGLLDRVNIHYADLSVEKIRTWRAVRSNDPMRMRVGLGPLARGWELEYQVPHGTVGELADHLKDLNLPDRKAIVVDTCCEGAAAEAVAAVMRYWRPDAEVNIEGVQVFHNTNFEFQHTLPLHTLKDRSSDKEKSDTWKWAWMMSEGRTMGGDNYGKQSIFQRSDELVEKTNQALQNYKSVLLGLHDGLESCRSDLHSVSN